jgi:hypothetical protein
METLNLIVFLILLVYGIYLLIKKISDIFKPKNTFYITIKCPRCKTKFEIMRVPSQHLVICHNQSCKQSLMCLDGKIVRLVTPAESSEMIKKENENKAQIERQKWERDAAVRKQLELEKISKQVLEENARKQKLLKEQQVLLSRKTDWLDYQRILNQHNIHTLYHFTDISNIPSIKQNGGLLSWHYCINNGISIPRPGGDELSRNLDTRRGLENYVRVCFTKNHPMLFIVKNKGRIPNPVILEINPEIILQKGTKYSSQNATRAGASIGETLVYFKLIEFDVVKQLNHFDLTEDQKPYYQAEILVPVKIPLEYITNINYF